MIVDNASSPVLNQEKKKSSEKSDQFFIVPTNFNETSIA